MKTINALSIMAAVLGLAAVGRTQSLTTGLVAYYPFNGNANDESGNGNSGVVVGAVPTFDRFGHAQGAYAFDGTNSHVRLGARPAFTFDGDFTLSLWFQMTNRSPKESCLFAKSEDFTPGSYFLGFNATQDAQAGVVFSTLPGNFISGNFRIPLQQWLQMTLVYRRAHSLRLYVNGAIVGHAYGVTNAPTDLANNVPAYIGRCANAGYFRGSIDDVRVYRRALSQHEVVALHVAEWVERPDLYDILKSATYGGHTYVVSRALLSSVEAQQFAKRFSGHLAVPDNLNENTFVRSLTAGGLWLGLHRQTSDSSVFLRDTDDSPATWTSWYAREPNNGVQDPWNRRLPEEWYVEMYGGTAGVWNDVSDAYRTLEYGGVQAVVEIDKEVEVQGDSDGDGLSDYLEETYYGTAPDRSDTDADGFSDGDEVAAKTDPMDPRSRPEALDAFAAVELQYFTNEGFQYQLYASTDLQSWLPWGEPFVGTGSTTNVLVSTKGTQASFWQLKRLD